MNILHNRKPKNLWTMKNSLVFIASICAIQLLSVSCKSTQASSHEVPSKSTSAYKPSATPSSTIAEPTPISTFVSPMSYLGPKVGFRKSTDPPSHFSIIDVPTLAQIEVDLPNDGFLGKPSTSVSPDSKYIAYFTGSFEEPYDLSLHLFNLDDGSSVPVSPLFSRTYAEDIDYLAGISASENPFVDSGWLLPVELALRSGITSLAWSPGGEYLAFASQKDGPSSNLYVFETESSRIQQMSEDLFNIASIGWSPDGDNLLYEGTIPGQNYQGSVLSIVEYPGETGSVIASKEIESGFFWSLLGWVSPSQLLLTDAWDAGYPTGLRIVDVITDEVSHIWPGTYFDFAYDTEKEQWLVSGDTTPLEDRLEVLDIGLYSSIYGKGRSRISDMELWLIGHINGKRNRFLGADENGVYLVGKRGEVSELTLEPGARFSISPDGQWFVVITESGYSLYSSEGKIIYDDSFNPIGRMVWQPDSNGFVFSSGPSLKYKSVQDNVLLELHECISEDCYYTTLFWLDSDL